MRTFQGFWGRWTGHWVTHWRSAGGRFDRLKRYANVPTLSTPRDFGLHHVEEHLLFTAANDALSHLDLVERLLQEVNNLCQRDVTPHLDALSIACPTSFRDRLRETRNLLAAHRDERVLYRRLTGEHTARVPSKRTRSSASKCLKARSTRRLLRTHHPLGHRMRRPPREPPASARSAAGSPTW